jgi:hypothetical protein
VQHILKGNQLFLDVSQPASLHPGLLWVHVPVPVAGRAPTFKKAGLSIRTSLS